MNERLHHLLSDVGESSDYLRSDVRNLSRYMAELEELVEGYRAFASNATLATQADRVTRRKLLKKTQKVIGPPPELHGQDCQEAERPAPGDETLEVFSAIRVMTPSINCQSKKETIFRWDGLL